MILSTNLFLWKKLNPNSITPCEWIKNFIYFFIYSHFYLSITRKRRGAIQACLGVADHLSTIHSDEGIPFSVFPSDTTSELNCRLASHSLFYAERQAGKL